MDMSAARLGLEAAVLQGEVPGAVALTGDADSIVPVAACGVTRLGEPFKEIKVAGTKVADKVDVETRFDLASLSKVVGTLPAVLTLVQAGEVSLDSPIKRFFSNAGWFQTPSLGDATVRQLLTHTAGLPAWRPLYAESSTRLSALGNLLQTPLERPAGTVVYSDLGFMLLGALVERVSKVRLDVFTATHVFGPLEMTATGYGVPDGAAVAATEDCGWRGRVLQGEVHDENAFVFDGVAGHAGLFGTAHNLARYAQAWLRLEAPFASPELLREATLEHAPDAVNKTVGGRRGWGWQLAGEGSSAGHAAGPNAYGHTGFTGTSLWIDPDKNRFAVLLTNRVHPSRTSGKNIHALRVAFHDAVFA